MYLQYPLSYQDVADLPGERGVDLNHSTVFRWVQKFGPELAKRTERHLQRASLNWHIDETYIRAGGKWRYLWRAIDAKAAKVFLNKAIERVRLHRPVSICMYKAPTYRKVIRDINYRYDRHLNHITHIDKKYRNNRVENDHTAVKRLLGYRQSFRPLRPAKATQQEMEAFRTIKNGRIQNP
jgi:IS6 family transposase